MFRNGGSVREGVLPTERFEFVIVVMEPYTRKQERPDRRPPLIVAECYSGLMEIPGCEERRLVEVRCVLLYVWARVCDRDVRRADAFHRVRDAGADFKETLLVAYCHLDVSFDFQMVFRVVGLFRIDCGLYIRREVFPPGACKGIELRSEQIKIIVVWGVGPSPRAGRVVARLESYAVIIEEIEWFPFAALSDLRRHSITGRAKLISCFVESGRRRVTGRTGNPQPSRKHRHRKHWFAAGVSRDAGGKER